jgi:hypothetical protein
MATTDFTFDNPLISAYFTGSNSYVPSAELMFVHTHPLIRNSFLAQIEVLINETKEFLIRKNMKGIVLEKFTTYTIQLGAELPKLSQQSAPNVLIILRNIYVLCNQLLKK